MTFSRSPVFSGLRGCNGDHAVAVAGSRRSVKSDNELRRFFLEKLSGFVGVPSPMLLNVLKLRCALPGRDLGSSESSEPEVLGLSRETGRRGGCIRLSVSVDLDLDKKGFDEFDGCG